MTYKLNPEIKKIISSVVIILPDGAKQEYKDGQEAASADFTANYTVESLKAVNGKIEISLKEQEVFNVNWCGEEEVSFF